MMDCFIYHLRDNWSAVTFRANHINLLSMVFEIVHKCKNQHFEIMHKCKNKYFEIMHKCSNIAVTCEFM